MSQFKAQNCATKMEFHVKKSRCSVKYQFKESKCANGGQSLNRDFTVRIYTSLKNFFDISPLFPTTIGYFVKCHSGIKHTTSNMYEKKLLSFLRLVYWLQRPRKSRAEIYPETESKLLLRKQIVLTTSSISHRSVGNWDPAVKHAMQLQPSKNSPNWPTTTLTKCIIDERFCVQMPHHGGQQGPVRGFDLDLGLGVERLRFKGFFLEEVFLQLRHEPQQQQGQQRRSFLQELQRRHHLQRHWRYLWRTTTAATTTTTTKLLVQVWIAQ